MTNGIVKKVGKKAAEEAVRVAKQVGQELGEIPKEAVRQTTGVGTSPIAEAMQQGGTSAPVNQEQIKAQEQAKLTYLEKELQKEVRKTKLAEQQRQATLQAAPSQAPKPPLVEPTTHPKRGMLFGLPGKQGTKEVIKNPSG